MNRIERGLRRIDQALQNQRRPEQHVTVTFDDPPHGDRTGPNTPQTPAQVSPPAQPQATAQVSPPDAQVSDTG